MNRLNYTIGLHKIRIIKEKKVMFNNFMDYEYQPYHKIYVHEISKYAIYLGDVSAAMDMDFIQN